MYIAHEFNFRWKLYANEILRICVDLAFFIAECVDQVSGGQIITPWKLKG